MGRQRKFSREGVIAKAMPVFWTYGYTGTSLHDLERATGVNRSGMYAEFKGKDDLFLACLEHYFRVRRGRDLLTRTPLGWSNIADFLKEAPSRSTAQPGCFSVNSIRELPSLPPRVRRAVIRHRDELNELIRLNVDAEDPRANSDTICKIVTAYLSGLCVECGLEKKKAVSAEAVDQFIAMLRSA